MTNKKTKLIVGIKRTIKEYLDSFCDDKSTPYLCKLKETAKGRKEIEDFVIKAFFNTDMGISDALVEKENMLNPNYLTD
jgi:hypothetical protein